MSTQQSFHFEKVQTVNINAPQEPEQSKDDIWRFRLEPRIAARIQAFCDAKRISRSDFCRDCVELGEVFHNHKDALLQHSDLVVEMLKRLSKNF